MTEPVRRVRVTNPLTTASEHIDLPVREEINESTEFGEVYMRSLIRSQLRAALTVVVTLSLSVGMLPVVFLLAPDLSNVTLVGIPLPWLILGVFVYPSLILLGWLYIRQVEKAEADFTELVEPLQQDEA